MPKDLTLSEHIHQHCTESMERALFAERHPKRCGHAHVQS